MSKCSSVELHVADGIASLRLNRPEKLNALDEAMITALAVRCHEIEHREDIDLVILSGNGKAFCAGGDIDAWSKLSAREFGRSWIRDGHNAFDALARLRQPVIAVINGHALGGGLELAACADFRIAEEHVKFGQPETGLGIVPGWSGTQRCVRRFGAQIVRRMAVFGEVFTAQQALQHGIVDRVVPTGEGLAAANELASTVENRGALATELTKMMINAAEGEERERIIDSIAGTLAAGTTELADGLSAYRARKSASSKKDTS